MEAQTQVRELMGTSVTDTNGAKVGTIKQVYLNDDSGAPEWVTVHTGWFGMRESFVPLSGARKNQDMLQVPYDKETIKGAPNVDADEHLSHAQIVDLYRHYGVRPPGGRRTEETGTSTETSGDRRTTGEEGRAGTGTTGPQETSGKAAAAGAAGTAGGAAGAAGMAVRPEKGEKGKKQMPAQSARAGAESAPTEITRSEERMRINTERHETGRVHVHKWIETEMVERTIPVSHEEIKIDREPIADGRPSAEVSVSEEDLEIILYEERPIIAKEAIPVERVRIRTEQVQDEQTVRGELRKERVEVTRDDEMTTERGRTGRGERGDRSR
ncbi:PRC and DUF2382 domain-containing protein [Actinomadura sp. KC345]|uniref:PRC and DUF2382 domain-containing protein n=1 Tax=Actinomadura sp. KC345 TaxID=2530371 RepID=UPI0014042DCC|nr:PRC and DUF2382 domain-containing protein [Actinomadura sp. KC345]